MHVLLNAVLRRRCCWAPAPAAVDRYLLPAGRSAANPPHAGAAVDRRTDGRHCRRWVHGQPEVSLSLLEISATSLCVICPNKKLGCRRRTMHTCRIDIASRAKIRRQKAAYHATPETLLQL